MWGPLIRRVRRRRMNVLKPFADGLPGGASGQRHQGDDERVGRPKPPGKLVIGCH